MQSKYQTNVNENESKNKRIITNYYAGRTFNVILLTHECLQFWNKSRNRHISSNEGYEKLVKNELNVNIMMCAVFKHIQTMHNSLRSLNKYVCLASSALLFFNFDSITKITFVKNELYKTKQKKYFFSFASVSQQPMLFYIMELMHFFRTVPRSHCR